MGYGSRDNFGRIASSCTSLLYEVMVVRGFLYRKESYVPKG